MKDRAEGIEMCRGENGRRKRGREGKIAEGREGWREENERQESEGPGRNVGDRERAMTPSRAESRGAESVVLSRCIIEMCWLSTPVF